VTATSERSEYLDGLRGFAILGVVLIHVGQLYSSAVPEALANFTNYGFRGVQLFFMISALTLTGSLQRHTADLRSYALRRFLRIAPMFYLAAVFYLILGGTGPSRFAPDGISPLDISLTFLMLHGFSLTSINSVVPGGWSVASEVIFYALLPLILLFATSLRRALLLLTIAIAMALLFAPLMHALMPSAPHRELIDDFSEFGFPANAPAFALGIVCYWLLRSRPARLPKHAGALLLALGLAGLIAVGCTDITWLRGNLVADLFLSLLVIGGAVETRSIVGTPALRLLGTVSFSLYLIHFAVIAVVAPLIDPYISDPVGQLVATYAVTILIAWAVSTLTYRYIEQPGIQLAAALSQRRAVPATSA
jgi:exopolysaccharide production protein ExoZ